MRTILVGLPICKSLCHETEIDRFAPRPHQRGQRAADPPPLRSNLRNCYQLVNNEIREAAATDGRLSQGTEALRCPVLTQAPDPGAVELEDDDLLHPLADSLGQVVELGHPPAGR